MINFQNLFLVILICNAFALSCFIYDKKASILKYYRFSNKKLIIIGFIGPIGAILATKVFKHKTKKFKKYIKKYFFYSAIFQLSILLLISLF